MKQVRSPFFLVGQHQKASMIAINRNHVRCVRYRHRGHELQVIAVEVTFMRLFEQVPQQTLVRNMQQDQPPRVQHGVRKLHSRAQKKAIRRRMFRRRMRKEKQTAQSQKQVQTERQQQKAQMVEMIQTRNLRGRDKREQRLLQAERRRMRREKMIRPSKRQRPFRRTHQRMKLRGAQRWSPRFTVT
jgi:hypothetical protein